MLFVHRGHVSGVLVSSSTAGFAHSPMPFQSEPWKGTMNVTRLRSGGRIRMRGFVGKARLGTDPTRAGYKVDKTCVVPARRRWQMLSPPAPHQDQSSFIASPKSRYKAQLARHLPKILVPPAPANG
jgi:hypothetical protein